MGEQPRYNAEAENQAMMHQDIHDRPLVKEELQKGLRDRLVEY